MRTNQVRNVYILFDYGNFLDTSTDRNEPFIQLLSTTDSDKAHQDFASIRQGNAASNTSSGSGSSPNTAGTTSTAALRVRYQRWSYAGAAGLAAMTFLLF